ncbi:hypothetical protein AOLI_G00023670 [Acnodon oligacanthus]
MRELIRGGSTRAESFITLSSSAYTRTAAVLTLLSTSDCKGRPLVTRCVTRTRPYAEVGAAGRQERRCERKQQWKLTAESSH